MLVIEPRVLICHFCEHRDAVVVFASGQGLCLECFDTLSPHLPPDTLCLREYHSTWQEFMSLSTLDLMKQAIVAMLYDDGMTKVDIAKRLHITRSTVYAYLRKAKKCK